MPARPASILTDIEGTTTPIALVHDVLFPYARALLPAFLDRHAGEPAIAAILAQVRALDGSRPPLDSLLAWMDADAKITPLKTLQGMIWDAGYRDGTLKGCLFPDVPPMLRSWHAAGIGLHAYSSGSEAAQRLLFGHSEAGDLACLFGGFFDTAIGPKRAPASYAAIAGAISLAPANILFLSDIEAELDAASAAGMSVCQLARAEDGTIPSSRHPWAADFYGVGKDLLF